MKELASIVAFMILGGLLTWGYQEATATQGTKAQAQTAVVTQRKAATAAQLRAGPTAVAWATQYGQVIELKIPSPALGGLFVGFKRCIVWRGEGADALYCDAPSATGDTGLDDVDLSNLR